MLAPPCRWLPLCRRGTAYHSSVLASAPGERCTERGPAVAAVQGLLCAPQRWPTHSSTRRTSLAASVTACNACPACSSNLWHVPFQ